MKTNRKRTWGQHGTKGVPGRCSAGFTLVEVMVALVLVTVALCGTLASTVSSSVLSQVNRETTVAYEAARQAMERVRARPFLEVFAAFNDTTIDDASVTDGAPGPDFAVLGLGAAKDDADGFVGRVVLPSMTNVLREDTVDARFGMPRDLTGDGIVDTADHAASYMLLPVIVRVEWAGVSGDRAIELQTVMSEK